MSHFVSERTREIGIRVALGPGRGDVLGLVGVLGIKLAVTGVAAGLALAFGLTRFIATFFYGVKPTDPLTYTIVAAGLVGVALVACYVRSGAPCAARGSDDRAAVRMTIASSQSNRLRNP